MQFVEYILADVHHMELLEDDDLLYGDLEDAGRSADFEKLSRRVAELTKKNEQLLIELNEAKQQLHVLVEEKAIVEKNTIVLYNTALREIDRKDKQIAQLQRSGSMAAISTPGTIGSSSSTHQGSGTANST